MLKNKLPQFTILWNEDKAALIDPESRVCLGVSKKIAENLETPQVQEKLYPVWKQQAEFQKRIAEQHENINTAYLMVTRKCNMNCDFCAINANKEMNMEKEFKLSDIKEKVVPFLKACCPHKLIVTGGEPLIKDRIIAIVKALHSNLKCPIILQSNGLAIDESIVKELRGNIYEIDFSTKHMFENPQKEEALRKHIELCQNADIQVVLSFIYEKTNKVDLHKVIDIAAKYDTGLLVNVVAPVGRAKENSDFLSDLERIEMDLDVAEYIYKKGYEEKQLSSLGGQMIQVRKSCGGYEKVMAIFPEGNIYMCQCLEENQFRMGNILIDSPEQVIDNLEHLLCQDSIKETFYADAKVVCNQCEYRYLCGGKCPTSVDKEDYTCYYVKKMIDYQLFYKRGNISSRKNLEQYITYLKKIKEYCPNRNC